MRGDPTLPDTPLDYDATQVVEVAGVNRLQQYLVDRMRDLDLSQAQVARRAGISKQRLNDLITGERQRIPEVEILEGLAVALEIPRRRLLQVAAETYNYVPATMDPETSMLVASLEELPEGRRRDIARLVELWRQESQEQEERRRRPGDRS